MTSSHILAPGDRSRLRRLLKKGGDSTRPVIWPPLHDAGPGHMWGWRSVPTGFDFLLPDVPCPKSLSDDRSSILEPVKHSAGWGGFLGAQIFAYRDYLNRLQFLAVLMGCTYDEDGIARSADRLVAYQLCKTAEEAKHWCEDEMRFEGVLPFPRGWRPGCGVEFYG